VAGCAGWLVCRLIPESHNQQAYDLFIGEVTAAWADERVFQQGRWKFDAAPDDFAPCTMLPVASSMSPASLQLPSSMPD
jgi:flavin reductase (DIM6/NTAB) family NADH-FMN oxidoreductase RutF